MKSIRKEKLLIMFLALGLLALLVVGCKTSTQSGNTIDESEAIAKVNGELITKEKFENNLEKIERKYKQQYGVDFSQERAAKMLPAIKKKVLNRMIQEELLLQKAAEENIRVTDQEITKNLNKVKKRYKSEAQFKKQLEKAGLSLEEIIEKIKKNLLIKKLSNKLTKNIKITEKEVENYFKNNKDSFTQTVKIKASHILVDTKKKANEIKDRLDSGVDFATLANKYSNGPSSKKGGNIGFFSKGQMMPAFEKVAFNLEVGEISEPVKTKHGYHIIKVTDKKKPKKLEFEDVKNNIKSSLRNQKKPKILNNYLKKVSKESKIEKLIKIKDSKINQKN